MMQNASFVRKIVYIVCIVLLLIPLSLIASPSTRDKNNEIKHAGGVLAKLRDENRLSQAKLGDIDPTSESMKLATLGLRPFAISMLWNQAHEFERTHNWDRYTATLNQLMKLQPNFVNVWEFQAHTLAYNTSREFDDYEDRYEWVKKGIKFLISGIGYNRYDHRMIDNIGRYFSMKVGQSDEKWQYRRLIRKDKDFHDELRDEIDVDAADRRGDGPDNYLIAREWYERSESMVEKENLPLYSSSALIFYLNVPKQARNFAKAIEVEFEPDEFARNSWKIAQGDWDRFGEKSIRSTLGPRIQLNSRAEEAVDLERLRAQLEAMVPEGVREKLKAEKVANRSDADKALMAMDPREVDLDDRHRQSMVKRREKVNAHELVEYVAEDQRAAADRLVKDIDVVEQHLIIVDKYRATTNYLYWDVRARVEISDDALEARHGLFHGWRLVDNQPYTEYKTDPVTNELVLDPETGEKIEVPGSVDEFARSFDAWADVFEAFPTTAANPHHLEMNIYNGDLEPALETYARLLGGPTSWPLDFKLQSTVDIGVRNSGAAIPTTGVLKQIYPERFKDYQEPDQAQEEAEKRKHMQSNQNQQRTKEQQAKEEQEDSGKAPEKTAKEDESPDKSAGKSDKKSADDGESAKADENDNGPNDDKGDSAAEESTEEDKPSEDEKPTEVDKSSTEDGGDATEAATDESDSGETESQPTDDADSKSE